MHTCSSPEHPGSAVCTCEPSLRTCGPQVWTAPLVGVNYTGCFIVVSGIGLNLPLALALTLTPTLALALTLTLTPSQAALEADARAHGGHLDRTPGVAVRLG